jgi:hypothetical protein
MLHPESSVSIREAAEVARLDVQAHASCDRACELGVTRVTRRPYRHVLELLAEQALPGLKVIDDDTEAALDFLDGYLDNIARPTSRRSRAAPAIPGSCAASCPPTHR